MATKVYSVCLSGDLVQPVTVPNGATFLSAVRWPDEPIQLHFLGDDHADAMTIVIEQVMAKSPDDPADVTEQCIKYLGSASGIWNSRFTTTHLFEVLS